MPSGIAGIRSIIPGLFVEMESNCFWRGLTSKHNLLDLYLLSSWDYRHESLCLTPKKYVVGICESGYRMRMLSFFE
jgi:hypothetical protein